MSLPGGEGRLEAGRRGCVSGRVAEGAEDLKKEAKPLRPYSPRLPNHHTEEDTQDKRTKQTAGIKMARTQRWGAKAGLGAAHPLPPLLWHPRTPSTGSPLGAPGRA